MRHLYIFLFMLTTHIFNKLWPMHLSDSSMMNQQISNNESPQPSPEIDIVQYEKERQYTQVLLDLNNLDPETTSDQFRQSLFKKLERLIEQGVSPNFITLPNINFNNLTGLITCVKTNGSSTLKKLLSLGADPNLQDFQKNTALMYAAKHNTKYIPDLLTAKADIALENNLGKTAFHYLVHENYHESSLRLLLYILMIETKPLSSAQLNKEQLIWNRLQDDCLDLVAQSEHYHLIATERPLTPEEICEKENKQMQAQRIQQIALHAFPELKKYRLLKKIGEELDQKGKHTLGNIFKSPDSIYHHLDDENGHIVAHNESSLIMLQPKPKLPEETDFKSILLQRNGIRKNILLFLKDRKLGSNQHIYHLTKKNNYHSFKKNN